MVCHTRLPYQASIRPHGHNLPRNEFPAGLEGAFRGIFNTAAAWNFHADNGDIPDIIETDDFRQLFRVIHHIQLWTADECDAAGYKVIVEIAIGKGGTVSCYQKAGILKIGSLDRSQLNLHRPLGQPAFRTFPVKGGVGRGQVPALVHAGFYGCLIIGSCLLPQR